MGHKLIRTVVSVVAVALCGAHLYLPSLEIDTISLCLIAIALIPWLAPLFRSIELPGGLKVQYQELQNNERQAEKVGLLSNAGTVNESEYSFLQIEDSDPNLALAGLRIEIEKRLLALCAANNTKPRIAGIGHALRELEHIGVLEQAEAHVLGELTVILNTAVHGAKVNHEARDWAIRIGPRILRNLDGRQPSKSPK